MLTILTPQATYPCRLLVNRMCNCFLTFIDKYSNVYQCFTLLWCLDRFSLQEYCRELTKTYQMALLGRRTLRRVLGLVEGGGGHKTLKPYVR